MWIKKEKYLRLQEKLKESESKHKEISEKLSKMKNGEEVTIFFPEYKAVIISERELKGYQNVSLNYAKKESFYFNRICQLEKKLEETNARLLDETEKRIYLVDYIERHDLSKGLLNKENLK